MMKTIVTLLLVAFLAVLIYNRQRVYLRDPLAAVYHNQLPHPGVEVYINYSSDVLLLDSDDPDAHRTLIQAWNHRPGTPARLTCVRWIACLTESDQPDNLPLAWHGKGKYDPNVVMTSREVTFTDADNTAVRIELR
jgi:hypothetical protein